VPTRKQRRRREKDFRHDVRVFEVDAEGNEVPIAELREREVADGKSKTAANGKQSAAKTSKSRGGRAIREVPPPSWQRAIKRGGLMGAGILVVFLFVLRNGAVAQRVVIGLIYAVAFIPLTYFIDRTAYRNYQRRLARESEQPKKR